MSRIHSHILLFLLLSTISMGSFAKKAPIVFLDLRPLLQADYRDSLSLLNVWDDLHTISTLQGVVNRKHPQLYIDYIILGNRDIDRYWWQKYRGKGAWLAGRDTLALHDVCEVAGYFSQQIRGAVVYDPNVASTSNVASSVAGLDDLIAIRYDERPSSLYSKLIKSGPRLPVKVWLVQPNGQPLFTGRGLLPGCNRASSGSLKCDPYLWFIEKYMKTGRCDGRWAGYYLDQYWRKSALKGPRNHHTLTNHDFFVSRRGFFFDLSPWEDEPATDDPTQIAGTDYRTLNELLNEAYRLRHGKTPCYVGGFPAWAYKYTRRVGGRHEDVDTEWHFAELISHHLTFKDADALGLGALANASFWQHFPLQKRYKQRWTSTEELKRKGWLNADGKVNTDKTYIIIYVGDYDASSWITQRTPDIWDSPERGQMPMMWCISPVLGERVPMVMHNFRATASPNDFFAAADNGAGYLMPGIIEEKDSLLGTHDLKAWERHCKKYYKRWGLTISGFIIDGHGPALGKPGLDCYARFSPNGIVPQKCPPVSLHKGMPVLRSDWDLVDNDPRKAAQVLVNRIHKRQLPFHWFRTILKSPAWHQQVVAEAQRLEPNIVLLDAPDFFELLRIWQQQ